MAIRAEEFVQMLEQHGVAFYTGVPDSLLKSFCSFIEEQRAEQHQVAANEGAALGLAIGFYLASGKLPLVYMQNSGLGNAINPLLSMADTAVYGIPMLLLIGWRGELLDGGKQHTDEPQHTKQGAVTPALLETMGIPFKIVSGSQTVMEEAVQTLAEVARTSGRPVALLVRRETFESEPQGSLAGKQISREEAIATILDSLPAGTAVIATTGKTGRELFALREIRKESHASDFLVIGGMGHASQIATGISLALPDKRVVCLDGDGSMLMHMGSALVTAQANVKHIIFNNGVHESVGGQATIASTDFSFANLARVCGYQLVAKAVDLSSLKSALQELLSFQASACLEVIVQPGSRSDLGRPTLTPAEMKAAFMKAIKGHD